MKRTRSPGRREREALGEGGEPLRRVPDRHRRPRNHLVAPRRAVGIDRAQRTADADGPLVGPGARRVVLGRGQPAARVERHQRHEAGIEAQSRHPVVGAGMDAGELGQVGEAVEARHQLRVALLGCDLRAIVVVVAFPRPRIEVADRQIEDAAVELQPVERADGVEQRGHLGHHVGVGDALEVVADHDRGELGHDLDDPRRAALADQPGDAVHAEVEIEAHLVAELHLDEAVAAGPEDRLREDHRRPSRPNACRRACLARATTDDAYSPAGNRRRRDASAARHPANHTGR